MAVPRRVVPNFSSLAGVAEVRTNGRVKPGVVYTVFSDEELRDIRETARWLKAAEQSFDFWNNPADAVYDAL